MLTDTPKRIWASTLSPSVTATSRMLSPKRANFSDRISASPRAARTHVAIARRHQRIGHVAGDGLARRADAGQDVGELAVAVRGLVQVHEVHVDLRVRQFDVRLRVEVQHRLLQRAEAVDPHLGGRERVHPRDDADAPRIGVDLEHLAMDPDRLGQHRLEHDGQRDVATGVELLHDGGRLVGDLSERFVAVEGLAAGEEPDLAIVVDASFESLHFCP